MDALEKSAKNVKIIKITKEKVVEKIKNIAV